MFTSILIQDWFLTGKIPHHQNNKKFILLLAKARGAHTTAQKYVNALSALSLNWTSNTTLKNTGEQGLEGMVSHAAVLAYDRRKNTEGNSKEPLQH